MYNLVCIYTFLIRVHVIQINKCTNILTSRIEVLDYIIKNKKTFIILIYIKCNQQYDNYREYFKYIEALEDCHIIIINKDYDNYSDSKSVSDLDIYECFDYKYMLTINIDGDDINQSALYRSIYRINYCISKLKKYDMVCYDANNYWIKKGSKKENIFYIDNRNLLVSNNVKILAIYFPQYHQIPENDKFWGEGFTEWTLLRKTDNNVTQIKKPHDDIGYYDLLSEHTRKIQEKLAKNNGLYGFMYYHYWFDGKPVMYKVLEKMLEENNPDLPYCFNWANESWSKRWDGRDNEILLEQKYGDADAFEKHYKYLSRFFKSSNYIKHNNKPLLLIYRVNDIKHLDEMTTIWNTLALEDGFNGIDICPVINSFHDNNNYICSNKWNYVMKFNPMSVFLAPQILKRNNKIIQKYDYDTLWKQMIDETVNKPEYSRNIFMSGYTDWCNAPRRDGETPQKAITIFEGSTPYKFEKYLIEHLKKYIEYGNEINYYFINAWNEWNEQAILEPDHINNYAYLDALKKAIAYFD